MDPQGDRPADPGLAGGSPGAYAEGDFALVHGSPRDPTWEYITTAPVARLNLALLEVPYGLHGHTHLPSVFRDEDGLIEMLSPSDDRP